MVIERRQRGKKGFAFFCFSFLSSGSLISPFSFFPFTVTSFIDTTHSQFTFFSCENDTCSRLLLQTLFDFEPFPCGQCTELPDNDFCSYFTPTCVFFLSVDNFACFAFVLNSSLSLSPRCFCLSLRVSYTCPYPTLWTHSSQCLLFNFLFLFLIN